MPRYISTTLIADGSNTVIESKAGYKPCRWYIAFCFFATRFFVCWSGHIGLVR